MRKITITVCACCFILLGIFIEVGHKKLNSAISKSKMVEKDKIESSLDSCSLHKDCQTKQEVRVEINAENFGQADKAVNLTAYRQELYNKYGFDAMLSDAISLQRSVPDFRPEACKSLKYLSRLPSASVVIIFHNERLSVLLRTVYSILNRSPAELLEEIILVDDGSTWPDMHDELEISLKMRFTGGKVRLIRLGKRTGIMAARNAGARQASTSSEILIFLDSHFEVGYNWLPPLLEPIEIDRRTCTCPIIDRIAYDTFEITGNQPWRGFFDYYLNYYTISLKLEEKKEPATNFKNYVMMGGAMAIEKDFFWQLGGFDDGMTYWGAEQLEMSFKIWMCGGQLIDVKCSRTAHLFRDGKTKAANYLYNDFSFLQSNMRRLLDVWIEPEQRRYFLDRLPSLQHIEPGDLSERISVRQNLKCKSFAWMMQNVMPDLHDIFLPVEPADLASGLIRSVYYTSLCMMLGNDADAALDFCPKQGEHIPENMNWQYNWRGELRIFSHKCIESNLLDMKVGSYICHFNAGNQKWYYDRQFQWLTKLEEQVCMLANDADKRIELAKCDIHNPKLKWTFSHVNHSEIETWDAKLKQKALK